MVTDHGSRRKVGSLNMGLVTRERRFEIWGSCLPQGRRNGVNGTHFASFTSRNLYGGPSSNSPGDEIFHRPLWIPRLNDRLRRRDFLPFATTAGRAHGF